MRTRQEALEYGLSFPDTYKEAPFHDQNWELVRIKGEQKGFFMGIRKRRSDLSECKGGSGVERFLEKRLSVGHSGLSSE